MSAILELNNSRELRMLRLLFFSMIIDVQDNHFNIKILKIKLKYRNKLYIYMKIMTDLNIHEQSLIFKTQRNKFLSHLINKEYYYVFKIFSHHIDFFYLI